MLEWFADTARQSVQALWTALSGIGLPALFFLALAAIVNRGRFLASLKRVAPETRLNLLVLAVNAVVLAPVMAFVTVVIVNPLWAAKADFPMAAMWSNLPAWAVILAAVFAGDFIGYWRHRFEHTSLLWPGHALHHSDTQMTWLTLERFHPINRMTTFLVDTTAMILLGFPAFAILANSLVRHYYGYFIHADLPWTYGPMNRVFVSPVMHRWHHAMDEKARNKNFATVFSVFDRAFGTYYQPGLCDGPLGVDGASGKGLLGQLLWPFRPAAYRRAAAETPAPAKVAQSA